MTKRYPVPAPLTFNDLEIGESFLFVGDNVTSRPDADVVVRRVKTSERAYEAHWDDGQLSGGKVGAGDNPIRRVA